MDLVPGGGIVALTTICGLVWHHSNAQVVSNYRRKEFKRRQQIIYNKPDSENLLLFYFVQKDYSKTFKTRTFRLSRIETSWWMAPGRGKPQERWYLRLFTPLRTYFEDFRSITFAFTTYILIIWSGNSKYAGYVGKISRSHECRIWMIR